MKHVIKRTAAAAAILGMTMGLPVQSAVFAEEQVPELLIAFAAVASPVVSTGQSEEIALGLVWSDGSTVADPVLQYMNNETGVIYEAAAAETTGEAFLFYPACGEEDAAYTLIGVTAEGDNGEISAFFADAGITAVFSVEKASTEEGQDSFAGRFLTAEEEELKEYSELTDAIYGSADVVEGDPEEEALLGAANRTYTVCLDPGHGGKDPGATNKSLDLEEAWLTHRIAYYCEQELKKYPFIKVVKTRQSQEEALYQNSTGADLEHRTQIAKDQGAELFFCIHINSATVATATGVEVYYPNANYRPRLSVLGKQVAQMTADNLEALGMIKRYGDGGQTGIKTWTYEDDPDDEDDDDMMYPDKSDGDYLSILRNCKRRNIPAVLVEHGFISNKDDCKEFFTEEGCKAMGIADAKAIAAYFNTNPDIAGYYGPADPKVKQEGKANMYRLYNPNSGEHFYTADKAERNMLATLGWTYEGIGWKAPAVSAKPVYRLYNPNAGDHHYTINRDEANMLIDLGWNNEGIGWYSDENEQVALYRQYNPNAVTGTHNYTTDKGEAKFLINRGWSDEGIAWYGIK